jgi:hypothetical protein
MNVSTPTLVLILGAGFSAGSPTSIGETADSTTWVSFYHRDFAEGRLSYEYDPASIRTNHESVLARWKVTSSRDSATTFYQIEIACRAREFSERGTVLVRADGTAEEPPPSTLLLNQRIKAGTSSDVFARMFCR